PLSVIPANAEIHGELARLMQLVTPIFNMLSPRKRDVTLAHPYSSPDNHRAACARLRDLAAISGGGHVQDPARDTPERRIGHRSGDRVRSQYDKRDGKYFRYAAAIRLSRAPLEIAAQYPERNPRNYRQRRHQHVPYQTLHLFHSRP